MVYLQLFVKTNINLLAQIDKILDDVSVQIFEDSEQLSEYVKRMLEVMEYDTPYTSAALMEKLGLRSKEITSNT